ncbi:protein Asterix-like [Canis lupus familiaris]|uniref:PAT complex subunit Asterix-like n=1 Tax=Canis lupus dingo TaxID=286419 RepID=UPI0015F154C9|nr:PAT complex subunit Asterix-like [Canis lupus dingo]XP_038299726.1 protein Asterix-like [Canis lupus familiaris]XP_038437676.1 protein Asterix-like [Canis lupus familiaris]
MSDAWKANKVLKYKPLPVSFSLDDPTLDYMNLLGIIFRMYSLLLKLKWCAWRAVYCSFISLAKHMSSFMPSISAVVTSYLQHPQLMTPFW